MSPIPEKWTWQMAEAALGRNLDNRKVRDPRWHLYGRLMKEKDWGVAEAKMGFRGCIAPIVFDWEENLIDGQHRLLGQVWSKTTQWWYVLRDVPTETKNTLDQQLPRTAADILGWEGYDNATVLQGVGRWAWLLERGLANSGRTVVGNTEIAKMIEDHPDLPHSASMVSVIRSGTKFFDKLIGPTPLGAAHWWIAQHNDHIEADIFLDRMAHMNREPDGSSILALWARLNAASGQSTTRKTIKENIQLRTKIAMVIRAWNTDVSGKVVTKMTARSKTGVFQIPKPRKRKVSQEESFGPTVAEKASEEDEVATDDEYIETAEPASPAD